MPQIFHKDLDINEIHNTGRFKDGNPIIEAFLQNGLNKRDKKSGLFIPCNMGLTEKVGARNPWHVNDGRYGHLSFVNPSALNKHEITLQYESGTGIRLRYEGANCSFESLTDNKPKFKAQDGVTLEHTPTYKGVSVVIVLDDPLNAPDSFKFSIDEIGTEYTLKEVNRGILLDGPEPIMIHAPWVEDGNGERGQAVLEIGPVEGGRKTIIKRIVDIAWLRQAAAPVKFDPFITIEDGVDGGVIEDTSMLSADPTGNYGTNIYGGANNYGGGLDEGQWSLLKVGLSAYVGATAISGKYILRPAIGNTTTMPGKCTKLLKAFVDSTATWNNRDTATPWDLGGAQETTGGTPDRASSDECLFDMLNTGITYMPITVPTLEEWLVGPNYGIVASGNGGAPGNYLHWGSSENTTVPIQFYFEYEGGGLLDWSPNSYYGNRKIRGNYSPQQSRRIY